MTLGLHDGAAERYLKSELAACPSLAFGQLLQQREPQLEMRDGLLDRGLVACARAGLEPVDDGPLHVTRLGVVPGERLGIGGHGVGKTFEQHFGNAAVIQLTRALEQRLIGGVLYKGVLEHIARARRTAPLIDELLGDELTEPVAQRLLIDARKRVQHLVGELTADDGTDLHEIPHRRQAVEARH